MCAIIKVITRDRTSAYAKAIAEEMPDAMQVADVSGFIIKNCTGYR